MPTALITAIFTFSGGLFGILITLLFSRKKNKAETLSIELENAQKVINIWRELSEEQAAKIEHLQEKVDELTTDFEALKRLFEAQCNTCTYRKSFDELNTKK